MPTKIHNTGITFPDTTIQTTAGGPVTTQYAIGSYVLGRPQDGNAYNNSTIAGSSLYATAGGAFYQTAGEGSGWGNPSLGVFSPVVSLVNTGSWRCVSFAPGGTTPWGWNNGYTGLWVRYA